MVRNTGSPSRFTWQALVALCSTGSAQQISTMAACSSTA